MNLRTLALLAGLGLSTGSCLVGADEPLVPGGGDCQQVRGPVQIAAPADVTMLEGICEVAGDLYVTGALNSLTLPALLRIRGSLRVSLTEALDHIDLERLQVVEGELAIVDNADLLSLTLPALSEVGREAGHALQLVRNPRLEEVSLTTLDTIGGTLSIAQNVSLSNVDMPSLRTVGQHLDLDTNEQLGVIGFPALAQVGGAFVAHTHQALATFTLPDLEIVGGDLEIWGNEGLASLALPVLTEVGGAVFLESPSLEDLEVPTLVTVGGDLSLLGNASLDALAVPGLQRVGGSLWIQGGDRLGSIACPTLEEVGESLAILHNVALVSLDLPSLLSVGDGLVIVGNISLAQCLVDALVAQVPVAQDVAVSAQATGNRDGCTCTEGPAGLQADCP